MKNNLKKFTSFQKVLIILLAIAMIGTDIVVYYFDKYILGAVGIIAVILIGFLLYKSVKNPVD